MLFRSKRADVPYVLDMDDDYTLPSDHILSSHHRQKNYAEQILLACKHAYLVTTTHERLGEDIKKKVRTPYWIVPNGIDPKEDQFKVREALVDKVTFGWSGSITHFDDVFMLHDALYSLYLSSLDFKMVYGGYDSTDTTSQGIAGILSCKGKANPNQFSYIPSDTVLNYARFYDYINCMLIPLKDNRFNSMKSNLKLLEAGFKKKAVICSDVHPYADLLTDSNSIKISSKKEWYNAMKYLITKPWEIDLLAEQLYLDVQEFHIEIGRAHV